VNSKRHPVVLAITGASGAPYAVRLLQALVELEVPTWLIVSSHGWRLLRTESAIGDLEALRQHVGASAFDACVTVFDDNDRGAAPASGSARTSGMVVCPCSMGTVSAIAHGTSRSLVERAADVVLKERRRLVLMVRETPLHLGHLRSMAAVTEAGAVVYPPVPAFYAKPQSLEQMVDHSVARVLDLFNLDSGAAHRWDPGAATDTVTNSDTEANHGPTL